MFNKKRLVMMAVAASMVLPTNLTYLSMTTAILAVEEEPVSPTEINADYLTTKSNTIDTGGDYILKADLTMPTPVDGASGAIVITATDKVVIDLGGKTITSDAKHVIEVKTTAEVIIKNGTIVSGSNYTKDGDIDPGTIIWIGAKANVTLDSVTLESSSTANFVYGLTLFKDQKGTVTAAGSTVTIKDSTIKAEAGVTVNGRINKTDPNSTIVLDNVKIEALKNGKAALAKTDVNGFLKDSTVGIYQAGVSTIEVKNGSEITSDSCGIETRAGTLTVTNSKVTGGTTENLKVRAKTGATTTENVGISVSQYDNSDTNGDIKVTLNNAVVTGNTALAITDPMGLQTSESTKENSPVEVKVNSSQLVGSTYDIAYTEDTIPFTLTDTTLKNNKIQKLVDKVNEDKTKEESIFMEVDGKPIETITPQDPPYTQITTPRPSGGGGNKKPTKPVEPEPEEPMIPAATPTSMYRLYNKLTGEHLYTIDKNERDNLLTSDTWKDEGEGWIAPSVSDYPVYRLLNPNNGDHHYTTDKNEFDTLPSYGWIAEGVAFFSADKENPENVLLHRLYNPNAEGAGSHHYTADTNERDALVAQGWKYEGLAWAGLPANK